jgi:hypothetical protein
MARATQCSADKSNSEKNPVVDRREELQSSWRGYTKSLKLILKLFVYFFFLSSYKSKSIV